MLLLSWDQPLCLGENYLGPVDTHGYTCTLNRCGLNFLSFLACGGVAMARLARGDLFDPVEVSAFHCINRCVRRCFLCGDDPLTGQNFDHRKAWLENRLKFLARQFGIDVLGFAILSNHFHLVLRNRPDVVAAWSDTEVASRWLRLCPLRKTSDGQAAEPNQSELDSIRCLPDKLAIIRRRLSDISWWMRSRVRSPVARAAGPATRAACRYRLRTIWNWSIGRAGRL